MEDRAEVYGSRGPGEDYTGEEASLSVLKGGIPKDLNVRPDTVTLLEENIGRAVYDINHRKILFDPSPREMEIKNKNKQMGPNET